MLDTSTMKLLVVLIGFIAFCAGNAIPLVPGDNSHYVEGESRYIWMTDGDNVPHLVDLEEPSDEDVLRNSRNGADNQYWLYTRQNPHNYQLLVNGNANSVQSSNYNSGRPLKVIIHGWNSNGNSQVNPVVRDAFLAVSDCNVIVVDWRNVANANYISAALGVPGVGQHVGYFLDWLLDNFGGNWNNVHLVGYSLGAHVVGNAGRTVGSRAARITGLDPAGPLWVYSNNALNANDGLYVEAIHTDGGLQGINNPLGRVNFYPNGGRNPQPGCGASSCSHSRAYNFFASTIYYNHLVGRQCSNLSEANNNQCTGGNLQMGNAILNKNGNGMYSLSTGSSWPF